MKQLFILSFVLLGLSFITIKHSSHPATDTLSKKEREYAVKFLKETENDVLSKVKGLSDAQLKYKPAPDRWSVEECLKHIAVTEQALWKMASDSIRQAADPGRRNGIKVTDEQLISMIEDRSRRFKTMDPFKPENTPFKSTDDALASFNDNRAKLIEYVKTTQDDLRDHVATFPFGMVDGYQMILFIGAHSNRHAQQMAEVMADAGFPRN